MVFFTRLSVLLSLSLRFSSVNSVTNCVFRLVNPASRSVSVFIRVHLWLKNNPAPRHLFVFAPYSSSSTFQ